MPLNLDLKDLLIIVVGIFFLFRGYIDKLRIKSLQKKAKDEALKNINDNIETKPLNDLVDQHNRERKRKD